MLRAERRGMVHVTQAGAFGHGAQGDEHQIILADGDLNFVAAKIGDDALHHHMALRFAEAQIGDLSVHLKHHAALIEPFVQRADHRIELVVGRPHDAFEPVEAGDHVGEADEIAFELDSAVPGLEGEGGAP